MGPEVTVKAGIAPWYLPLSSTCETHQETNKLFHMHPHACTIVALTIFSDTHLLNMFHLPQLLGMRLCSERKE